MATVRNILVAAYATNAQNRPNAIAEDGAELLALVNREVRALFSEAARINPTYFGKSASVAFLTSGWPLPADCEMLFRVESAGARVQVVPVEERVEFAGTASVYHLGRTLYGAGNAGDPTSGNLTLFYSRTPVDAATLDSVIDPGFPEGMVGILVGLVALYLDVKDGRLEDAAAVQGIRERWLTLWREHVAHVNAAEIRLNGAPATYPTPGRVQIGG